MPISRSRALTVFSGVQCSRTPGALAAAFADKTALKTAVLNCLGAVASGANPCATDTNCANPSSARSGTAGCDERGTSRSGYRPETSPPVAGATLKPRHRAPRNLRSLVAFLAFFHFFVPAWSQLVTISASSHSCAVYGDGTLECWGDNGRGQLGQGYTSTRENSRKTVELPSDYQGGTWSDVQCGTSFTCAILLNGSNRLIFCWGDNTYGQLGLGDNTDRLSPTRVEVPGYAYDAKILRVGSAHACAVMDDSTGDGLYCWGYNSRGQLGQGDNANSNVMKHVTYYAGSRTSADKIAELSLASADTFGANTCVLLAGRTCLRCWGDGRYGINGQGLNDELAPRTDLCIFESELGTDSGRTISQLGTGRAHICVLLDNGVIYCWGYGHHGMIGDGGYGWPYERVQSPKEAVLPEGRHATSLAVGHVNTYAVLDDNSLWCWGNNINGGLGPLGEEVIDPVTNTALYAYGGNFITVPKKAETFNLEGASVQIYAGSVSYDSCIFAVVQYPPGSQTVVGWGKNHLGQIIGDGDGKIFSPTNTLKCPTGTSTISNGVTSPCGEYLDSGSSCTPTCNSGYTLSGTRSCSAGTLTDTAVCNANTCNAAGPISNGVPGSACTFSLAHGSSCSPTCNDGYTLSGQRSCNAGELSDTAVCNGNDCIASTDSSKDGSDGSVYCMFGGTVGGSAGSCTCTCKSGYEGSGCETASACTASSDLTKDGSDGALHCSAQYGTIGGTTGSCTCTCEAGYGGSGCETAKSCTTTQYFDGSACQSCPTYSSSTGGTSTSCTCAANTFASKSGNTWTCANCTVGATKAAGSVVPGTGGGENEKDACTASPTPPTDETEKEKAEKTRDAMLSGIKNEKMKKKAKLLADAATTGKKVRKMSAKLTAPNEDTACTDYYAKAGLSSSLGACIATVASRRRGRALAATTYDVSVFFSDAEVDDSTLTAAKNALKAEGVSVEVNDVDPIVELGTIEGVDSSTLETFKSQATAAAATMPPSPPPPPVSSSPPPPPPSPPPNLIKDDDDHASAHQGFFLLLTMTALNFIL